MKKYIVVVSFIDGTLISERITLHRSNNMHLFIESILNRYSEKIVDKLTITKIEK